jgi:hypothetical protein
LKPLGGGSSFIRYLIQSRMIGATKSSVILYATKGIPSGPTAESLELRIASFTESNEILEGGILMLFP